MQNKNKIIFLVAGLIFFALLFYFIATSFSIYQPSPELAHGKVKIKDKIIWVDLAQTAEERAKGLGGRIDLADYEGMLFVFSHKDLPVFWMKDMKFPIDIIWLNDNEIVDITENVSAPIEGQENLPLYQPSQKVNYVLEVKSGFVRDNHINIGDEVIYEY